MLTNQHRFVSRMIHCSERIDYKKHMCGVCHALGDEYGMVSRLITNHEIILLNMLTEAQCKALPDTVMRRCPLNPTQHVKTNQSVSSQFAAAIAVMLVNTSVDDDFQDGKGLQLPTRLLKLMTSRLAKTAQQTLHSLQFDLSHLLTLTDTQSTAEANTNDPVQPSMQNSAIIFAMTSTLAHQPQNQPALATIGANYGAYLYLLDAVKDYSQDYEGGQFNPLLQYAHKTDDALILGQSGVEWLRDQFGEILGQIQSSFANLQLYHYQDSLYKLLTEPIQRMLNRLNRVTDGIHYAQVTKKDIWQSLLLMSEDKPKGESVDDFFSDEEGSAQDNDPKKKKRRRRRKNDSDDYDNDDYPMLYCIDCDICYCGDCDCDGVPNCIDSDVSCCGVDGCDGGCDSMDCDGCDGGDCGGDCG